MSLAGEVAIQRVEIPYKLAEIYGGTESDCRWFGMVKPARSDHSAKRLSSNHAISLAIQGRQKCGNLAVADLESISQHAWSEIAERIDWATRYITKNAQKAQQSKDKQNIISALEKCRGKVFGENGAAKLLDIKPTTLSSRIKRYNIDTKKFKHQSPT